MDKYGFLMNLGINQQQSESAREMMQNVQTMQQLGHDEEDIIGPQDADTAMMEEEDEGMDAKQLKEIERAKEIREKKRKLNSGDFISLNSNAKEDRRTEFAHDIDKNKVLMNIFNDNKKENRPEVPHIEQESDEELNELEEKILRRNVDKSKL